MSVNWKYFFRDSYKSDKPYYLKAGYGNKLSVKLRRELIKKIIRKFYSSGICVDIGCGSGIYCDILPTNYVGIDFVFEALTLLKQSCSNKYVCVACATDLPINDEISYLTISIEAVQYIKNFDLFFREVSRITKHGGIFIMIAPNPDSIQWILMQKIKGKSLFNFIDIPSTINALKKFNFSVLKIDSIFAPLFPLNYLNLMLDVKLPYNFIKTFSKSFVIVAKKI